MTRSATDRRPPSRSDARRDAILEALAAWLRQAPLDQISIAEIANQAGVTRSAFYFYFENKASAVAALTTRIVDEVADITRVLAVSDEPPQQRLDTMVDALFGIAEDHRHLFAAMLEARGTSAAVREVWDGARETFVEPVAEMIRTDRAAGTAPDGIDPVVLASVLLELNDRLLERVLFGGGALTPAQLRSGAAALWQAGIYGTVPGGGAADAGDRLTSPDPSIPFDPSNPDDSGKTA